MTIIYRANNMAEMSGIPEHIVSHVGLTAVVGGCLRVIMCDDRNDTGILLPRCELIGPLYHLPEVIARLQAAKAKTVASLLDDFGDARAHHH